MRTATATEPKRWRTGTLVKTHRPGASLGSSTPDIRGAGRPGIVGLLTLMVTLLVTALSVARERE